MHTFSISIHFHTMRRKRWIPPLWITNHYFMLTLLLILLNGILPSTCHHYSNTWAVRIPGGEPNAREVAEKHGFVYLDQIMPDIYHLTHPHIHKRSLSHSTHHHNLLNNEPKVLWFEQQVIKSRKKRDLIQINDPKWNAQWYLHRKNSGGRMMDMNVLAAWSKGYTGKGVVVTILDDGIERTHPDLFNNYAKIASKDINGGDDDPMPRYDYTNENRHGTRCAGEVAAQANNRVCGVGIAYNASIGGIRMLDGDVTDAVEAMALSYNRDKIHIYSASWGPDDDGKTIDGPAGLARQAFRDGIKLGRNRLGSIFIWASGNGGRDQDSCNCDGYTNSIYTLSISSATEHGNVPWYSEACSSTLATTYSSGEVNERQIVTTDLNDSCTEGHTGTSASAPLAAGIVALALEANPQLTWRDMQYLVVMSANPNNLHAADWRVNGAGRRVSHHFGYGIMNAGKMVDLAKNWTTVPEQKLCEAQFDLGSGRQIPAEKSIRVKLYTDGCRGSNNHVNFLEHVQAKISVESQWRGDIQIWLTSPSGTKSTLLASRVDDASRDGFRNWAFMTTHNWGELSSGDWELEVSNGYRSAPAKLTQFMLIMHGTTENPIQGVHQAVNVNSRFCTDNTVLYRDECVQACPHGWFPLQSACYSCHVSCASCYSADNTSCTECYHGATKLDGSCIQGIKPPSGANEDPGLPSHTIWWLMVGATVAVCMLVLFLVALAIYYAYTQGYLCKSANTSNTTPETSSEEGSTPSANSKHSSQQELMSSEDEGNSDDENKFTEIHSMIYV